MPVSALAEVAEPLVAVHGQSDQHRLLQAAAQREALDRFGGAEVAALLARRTPRCTPTARATERELDEVVSTARERAREADLLRFGLGEIEAVAPEPGEDAALAAEEARLGFADTLRTAAEQAREALSSEQGGPDALAPPSAARARCSTASATTTPRPASSPTGWPSSPTCSPTSRPTSRRTPPGSRPTRPGWPPSPSGARR